MVAHKTACNILSKAAHEISEDMVQILLMLEILSQRFLRLKNCSTAFSASSRRIDCGASSEGMIAV